MRSTKIKNIVLSTLTVALIYIWYGNAQLFWGDDTGATYEPSGSKAIPTRNASDATVESIEFVEPKLNPFAESATPARSTPNQTETDQARRSKAALKHQTPLLSSSYKLVGSLYTGKRRMATLADNAGKQILVSRGDSLSGWRAINVGDRAVIFAQESRRDTLRLSQVGLE